MLLNINTKTAYAERCRTERIQSFGLDERGLQGILFKTLDQLFPDDELILLMQSRRWREEPDLMAVDKNGDLFIFELKAWESDDANLLQVLRYGQIYGASKYAELDVWNKKSAGESQSLKAAHDAKFGTNLSEESFNRRQVFVVMTNGLDYRTREAVRYWRSCGLDVRPWVYRVYAGGGADDMQLEISAFRVSDNPYEDIAEGYYILNTNIKNNTESHDDMLSNAKAAAYYDPWKYKIERLKKGDTVFLYQSGVGIVAFGDADGKLRKAAYEENPDEEYSMKLNKFQRLSRPLSASEIKSITGIDYRFMTTMFGVDADSGKKIRKFLHDDGRL
jgi:hypothetical protein